MITVNGVPLTEIVSKQAGQPRHPAETKLRARAALIRSNYEKGKGSLPLTDTEIHEITNEWLKAQSRGRF